MRLIVGIFLFSLAVAAPGHAAPSAAESAMQLAIAEYKQENYEEALKLLLQIRTAKWSTPMSDYYTGLCQKEIGEYDEAAASLTSALKGQPPVKEAALDLVASLVNLDRQDEALKWVAWAEKEKIQPKETAYQKGLILSKKKRYSEARTAFLAAKGGSPELEPTIDQFIAMSYDQEGKTKEARASYKAIVTRYPGTDVATFAQEYEQRMSIADKAKHWSLVVGANYQYDDNVQLKDVTATPNKNASNAFNQSLRFEYDKPLTSTWSSNFQYSFQNSNYAKYHGFDMLNHGLTASVTHLDESFITTLPLNITHFALDYRNNSLQYSFKPTETVILAPEHLGMLTLGYTRREMSLTPSIHGGFESFTTGDIYNGQLSYIFLFAEGQGMATLRGEIFYEDTVGPNYQNLGRRVGADLLLPLGKTTKLSLSAEGAWQDYSNFTQTDFSTVPPTSNLTPRYDTTVTASVSLNQKVCNYFYLNSQYSFTRAMSNIDINDYRKNVFSAGIEFRF